MSTTTELTDEEVLQWLDDNHASHFIKLDTGWRGSGEETIGGWHCEIIGPGVFVEGHGGNMIEAARDALRKVESR